MAKIVPGVGRYFRNVLGWGFMITVILVILVIALWIKIAYQRHTGVRAKTAESITVTGLALDQVLAIGVKASAPVTKRMFGSPRTHQEPDGSVEWQVGGRGGVMLFHVMAVPEAGGFQVTAIGAATPKRAWGMEDVETAMGWAHIMHNFFCRLLGIPQNARQLIRWRSHAFTALTQAGAVPQTMSRILTLVPDVRE